MKGKATWYHCRQPNCKFKAHSPAEVGSHRRLAHPATVAEISGSADVQIGKKEKFPPKRQYRRKQAEAERTVSTAVNHTLKEIREHRHYTRMQAEEELRILTTKKPEITYAFGYTQAWLESYAKLTKIPQDLLTAAIGMLLQTGGRSAEKSTEEENDN